MRPIPYARLRLLARVVVALACAWPLAGPVRAEFIMGADLSMLQHLQDHGVEYRENGQVKDPLLIFKDHGCNYVRLRLFVAPDGTDGQVNTLPYTLKLAKRVKAAGLKWILDFHYSDKWADPLHQYVPEEWKNLTHPQLVDRVHAYTRETLQALRQADCFPDMVAVGNEITNGMMWPDGGPLWLANDKSIDPAKEKTRREEKWNDLADLLKAGVRAVRESDPDNSTRIMIHIDRGNNKAVCHDFFDHLRQHDVSYDVMGLSYYPFWNGSLSELRANLALLADRYGKDIVIAETAYDTWGGPQKDLPYPLTDDGQAHFMEELIRIVAATPNSKGVGVIYWAPEWIQGKKWGGPEWSGQWENRALFDASGNVKPAMNAFKTNIRNR